MKRWLKILLKLALSGLAIYIIVTKVDLKEAGRMMSKANILWMILAALMFFISKIIAALRVNVLYRSQGLIISEMLNAKLVFLSMFYNLFVPLVGGEGYKAYWLKRNRNFELKTTVGSALLDRLSGLAGLACWATLFFQFTTFELAQKPLFWLAIPLVIGGYFVFVRLFFRRYLSAWVKTAMISIVMQGFQVLTVWFVVIALGIDQLMVEYIFVFLLATFAFVLPMMGAREAAFVFGSEQLGLNMELSLAIGLMFYLTLLASTAVGIVLFFFEKSLRREEV